MSKEVGISAPEGKASEVIRKRRAAAPAPKWTAPNLDVVTALAARCLSESEIIADLGINMSALKKRKRAYASFTAALLTGRARGIVEIAAKLYEVAVAGNVKAMKFYLVMHAGWDVGATMQVTVEEDNHDEALVRAMTPQERRWQVELIRTVRARMKEPGVKAPGKTAGPPVTPAPSAPLQSASPSPLDSDEPVEDLPPVPTPQHHGGTLYYPLWDDGKPRIR